MSTPDSLKPFRLYVAMFLLNIAVVIGVIYLLRREEPRPVVVTQPPTRPATSTANKSVKPISVTVNGAVNQPGTFELTSDARLADALQKAGVQAEADLSKLNLTLMLKDGDKINVPSRAPNVPTANTVAAATTSAPQPTKIAAPAPAATKVNLNTATLEQLDALPGIGPAIAQRILDYRSEKGSFKSIEELKEVRGIGDALYNEIRELVAVE